MDASKSKPWKAHIAVEAGSVIRSPAAQIKKIICTTPAPYDTPVEVKILQVSIFQLG